MHTITDTHSIEENLRTSKKAIAPGAIRSPIAKIRPAADSVAIMVKDKAANKP
jgi:hypothetical protein